MNATHVCINYKNVPILEIGIPFGSLSNISFPAVATNETLFISVFNQLDTQNLFHNKFYFMPLYVSSTCAHHQEVKIALPSLWYHQTYRCDDTRGWVMQF